jgi:hypothetical protein
MVFSKPHPYKSSKMCNFVEANGLSGRKRETYTDTTAFAGCVSFAIFAPLREKI